MHSDDIKPLLSSKPQILIDLEREFGEILGPRTGVAHLRGVLIFHDFDWAQFYGKEENRFRGQKAASETIQVTIERYGRCDFILLTKRNDIDTFAIRQSENEVCVIASADKIQSPQTKRIELFRAKSNSVDKETRDLLARLPQGEGLTAALSMISTLYESEQISDEEIDILLSTISELTSSRITPNHITTLLSEADESVSRSMAIQLMEEYPEAAHDFIRDEYLSGDVQALAYRRQQLDIFERLLRDPAFFSARQQEWQTTHGPEPTWQHFFEQNTWIFGYGLSLTFHTSVGSRLEQTTAGSTMAQPGKRADALMRTASAVSSLCFVEIKHHKTKLCEESAYRSGCFAPSSELAGGICQVQTTVQTRDRTGEAFLPRDVEGLPLCEIYHYLPQSFLIIGDLGEFTDNNGRIQAHRFRSFELFRRNILNPEILTFDELYERTRHIVDSTD